MTHPSSGAARRMESSRLVRLHRQKNGNDLFITSVLQKECGSPDVDGLRLWGRSVPVAG